ncbi:MAG: hypothetical protein N838_33400 [Thiohalocapsa sp. PB-PSB1]|nr:MAG: hypothetical protein N838_33400 [Thiohalocapsa sp. PB-PSB1]
MIVFDMLQYFCTENTLELISIEWKRQRPIVKGYEFSNIICKMFPNCISVDF